MEVTQAVADEPPPQLACGTHADVSNILKIDVVKEPPQFGDAAYVWAETCVPLRHARRIEVWSSSPCTSLQREAQANARWRRSCTLQWPHAARGEPSPPRQRART